MNAASLEADWQAPTGVRALCTLKAAGSFGSADSLERDRITALLHLPLAPSWLKQVHGTRVVDLDAPEVAGALPEADAAVTARPGVVCAVLTADCLPVLLAAADGSAVGAAHAGWRGLCAGVIENAVVALRGKLARPTPLRAWLGPAIGPANFEVGDEVRAAFLRQDPASDTAFAANSRGRWQCDLYTLARRRLSRLGIEEVWGGGLCTYADARRFHSHRRDVTHAGGVTGRMASIVWREPA